MNSLLLAIILIPAIEIYLFIKIGANIGAFNTVLIPAYELISGAFIGIGAIFLIIPGFATDLIGFLIIFPLTRKILFKIFSNKNKKNYTKKKDYIEGEYKDLDESK